MSALVSSFFFFNDTATTEIYTLSLHDALPIYALGTANANRLLGEINMRRGQLSYANSRSEEHTSELQSRSDLVCRLLLEKKKDVRNERWRADLSEPGALPLTHGIHRVTPLLLC